MAMTLEGNSQHSSAFPFAAFTCSVVAELGLTRDVLETEMTRREDNMRWKQEERCSGREVLGIKKVVKVGKCYNIINTC